jgi:hypothetical protein
MPNPTMSALVVGAFTTALCTLSASSSTAMTKADVMEAVKSGKMEKC